MSLLESDNGEADLRAIMDIGWCMHKQNSRPTRWGQYVTKVCLGSVLCMNSVCPLYSIDKRPRYRAADTKAQCKHCEQVFIHVPCDVKVKFDFQQGTCRMYPNIEKGSQKHSHGTYPPLHLHQDKVKELEELVVSYPDETAKVLVVGNAPGFGSFKSVRSIHPILQNLDRTKYECRKIAKSYGISRSDQTAIEDFLALQKENPGVFRVCNINIDEFFISIKADSINPFLNF